MFTIILNKSIKLRKGRIMIAVLSVVIGAAMISALANLSMNMKQKLGTELRAYGANINMVADKKGDIGEEQLVNLKKHLGSNLYGYAPYTTEIAEINNQEIVVVGTDIGQAKKIFPWWKLKGGWDSKDNYPAALLGINAAKLFKISTGQTIIIRYKDKTDNRPREGKFLVSGILDSGGLEDNEIILERSDFRQLFGENAIDSVQISALTDKQSVEQTAVQVSKDFPRSKTSIIKQIAGAEGKLLNKIQLLMLFVTVIVLFVTGISVMSTMATTVMERRREIGILKSIGAENKKIARLFNAEAGVIGLAGGILGFGLGIILAQIIGKSVFNTYIKPDLLVFPATILLSLIITMIASRGPVREATITDPVVTLRGE